MKFNSDEQKEDFLLIGLLINQISLYNAPEPDLICGTNSLKGLFDKWCMQVSGLFFGYNELFLWFIELSSTNQTKTLAVF